jgi:hypothetical protein
MQDTDILPLGHVLSIGAQLKNRLNTWYSVVEATDPNALPTLNAPYKVNVYPPCIANVSILDETSGCMEGMFFRNNKKDSINALYWHIILHVSTPKRGNGVGAEPTWRPSEGWPDSIDALWCAQCFAVLEMGVGPNEIVIKYNP